MERELAWLLISLEHTESSGVYSYTAVVLTGIAAVRVIYLVQGTQRYQYGKQVQSYVSDIHFQSKKMAATRRTTTMPYTTIVVKFSRFRLLLDLQKRDEYTHEGNNSSEQQKHIAANLRLAFCSNVAALQYTRYSST